MVPLKQSPAAHRIHLPAGRRVSTHSAQRRTAHKTGCGLTVQISSQIRPMASKFAEYEPNGLSRMGCNVGGLP